MLGPCATCINLYRAAVSTRFCLKIDFPQFSADYSLKIFPPPYSPSADVSPFAFLAWLALPLASDLVSPRGSTIWSVELNPGMGHTPPTPPPSNPPPSKEATLLWVDQILHHLDSMENRCLFIRHQGFRTVARNGFRSHPRYFCFPAIVAPARPLFFLPEPPCQSLLRGHQIPRKT